MNWTWQKYKVLDVQDDIYTVCNEKDETFQFRLHFYDLMVEVGDILTISSVYLYEFTEYGLVKYYFGPLNTKFSKKLTSDTEYEKLMIEHDNQVITYQRYYG